MSFISVHFLVTTNVTEKKAQSWKQYVKQCMKTHTIPTQSLKIKHEHYTCPWWLTETCAHVCVCVCSVIIKEEDILGVRRWTSIIRTETGVHMAVISFRGHAFPSTKLYSAHHTHFGNENEQTRKDDEIILGNANNSLSG